MESELAYDGLGRCARTRVNGAGVVHVYDGHQRVQDRDERTGALVAEYTYLQGQLHKWRQGSDEHWVYIEPQGGWPRHLSDAVGDITDSFDVDWQGQELLHQGTTEVPIGWGGGWKLAADSELPLLLMPGTNEVWCPTLGKSLNPLASMSSALLLTTAIGGYAGEVIGLPVKLPTIPSWGSAPGYPWWPGQSGPQGGTPRNDAGSIGSGAGFGGQSGAVEGARKGNRGCPPNPPPYYDSDDCSCCDNEELTAPAPGGPTPSGAIGKPCGDIKLGKEATPFIPGPMPVGPPAPVGPGIPTEDECRICIGVRLGLARTMSQKLSDCMNWALQDCLINNLNSFFLASFYCSNDATMGWRVGGCTNACSGTTSIIMNCHDPRPIVESAASLIHENLHACFDCKRKDMGPCRYSKNWDAMQKCMIFLCSQNCPGLVTPGSHYSDGCERLANCSGLLLGCGFAVCPVGVWVPVNGAWQQVWGGAVTVFYYGCLFISHSNGGKIRQHEPFLPDLRGALR